MGVYDSIEDVEQAVQKLREKGASIDGISIIGQGLQSETKVSGFVRTGDVVKEGVGTGAFFGGPTVSPRRRRGATQDSQVAPKHWPGKATRRAGAENGSAVCWLLCNPHHYAAR